MDTFRPLAAPDAFSEEFRRRRVIVVPEAAHRIGLMAVIEQTDEASGMVIQADVIVPRAETKERFHLHHLYSCGVRFVGKMDLRDLLGGSGRGAKAQEQRHGGAAHGHNLAPRPPADKADAARLDTPKRRRLSQPAMGA